MELIENVPMDCQNLDIRSSIDFDKIESLEISLLSHFKYFCETNIHPNTLFQEIIISIYLKIAQIKSKISVINENINKCEISQRDGEIPSKKLRSIQETQKNLKSHFGKFQKNNTQLMQMKKQIGDLMPMLAFNQQKNKIIN